MCYPETEHDLLSFTNALSLRIPATKIKMSFKALCFMIYYFKYQLSWDGLIEEADLTIRGFMGRKIVLTFSGIGLWILMMPANLYGLFGVFISAGIAWRASGSKIWQLTQGGKKTRFLSLIILILLYYVLLSNFQERWILSSVINRLAVFFGVSVAVFLYLICAVVGVISLPFAVSVCEILMNISAESTNRTGISRIESRDIVFCLLAALCFSLLLCLAPLSNIYPGSDSTVFLYIGQQMKRGLVPYTDLFDHKGILMYWLEWFGMTLTPDSFVGVWLVEVVNLFALAIIILKIGNLFALKKMSSYFTVLVVLATFNGYLAYEGGNLVEEYALPWISLALYLFLKYFETHIYRLRDIIWIGIGFMIVLLLRVNMITVWIAFLPIIFFSFLYKKKWKDVGKCILGFGIGCSLVLVPVLLYAYRTDCLVAMWRYYVQFNLGYSESESNLFANVQTAWFLMTISFVGFAIFVLSAIKFRKNRIYKLNLWYGLVSIILASMSGRLYYHYGITLMPILIVPTVLLFDSMPLPQTKIYERLVWGGLMAAVGLQLATSAIEYKSPEKDEMVRFICERSEETDNVLIIGNTCYGYLQSGRTTTNRFFYQTPPINISDDLCDEFIQELQDDYPKLVIVKDKKENWVNENGNLERVVELLEEETVNGKYIFIEQDDFCAYERLD